MKPRLISLWTLGLPLWLCPGQVDFSVYVTLHVEKQSAWVWGCAVVMKLEWMGDMDAGYRSVAHCSELDDKEYRDCLCSIGMRL